MLKGLESRIRLPRLGIIRLGITEISAKSGKVYPREVDHFVLPDDLRPLFPDRPTRLPVMFPSDDLDRVLSAAYEKRAGKSLDMRCDGEQAITFETGEVAPCQKAPMRPCPRGCQAKAHLNVIIPTARIGTYWVLIGGEQRIADLFSELSVFKATFGRLSEIVFELERVPTQVQVRTDKGVIAKTGFPVHLRCAMAADQALRVRGLEIRELPGGQILQPALPEAEEEVAPDEGGNGGEEPSVTSAENAIINPGQTVAVVTPSDSAPTPWTIEACFAAAKRAGVGAEDYSLYLTHKHRRAVEDLSPEALLKEGEAWAAAEENALARETLKSVILTIASVGKTKGR